MANPKGNPQNLKRPVKGGPSPNPAGRPPDALNRAMKKLTKEELEDIANMIIKGDIDRLQEVAKNPKETVIKVMVASSCIQIIKKGDLHSLDLLLNRLIGKVKDKVEIGNSSPTGFRIKILDGNGNSGNS